MNEERQKAFNKWWFEHSSHNPNDIWDAACDWMKEEILKRIEEKLLDEKT